MQPAETTLPEIHELIDSVKSQSSSGFHTNYFRNEMPGEGFLQFATDRSVVFLNDDIDFHRLFFFTTDVEDFAGVLERAAFPIDTVASYVGRTFDEHVTAAFTRAGFERIATYRRIVNDALRVCEVNDKLEYAAPTDVEAVYSGLLEHLDKHTDHFPSPDRLAGYIRDRQVLVVRREGTVVGCLVFRIQGKRVNLNYLYNASGNALDLIALVMNFYGVMHARGISSGFGWVNETNTGVIRMHRGFGWTFDGLEDHYFAKWKNR